MPYASDTPPIKPWIITRGMWIVSCKHIINSPFNVFCIRWHEDKGEIVHLNRVRQIMSLSFHRGQTKHTKTNSIDILANKCSLLRYHNALNSSLFFANYLSP